MASQYPGKDLEAMSFAANYHRWIMDELRPYLRGDVAEVGAGMGNVSRLLLEAPIARLVAYEPSANMFALLEQSLRGEPRAEARNAFFGQRADERFDTVAYINVLEHVEDDRGELARIHERLVPGGHLLVFVPALSWLMSDFDRSIGHFRRYTRAGLSGLVEGAGFEVVKARYFDVAGVLPWYVNFVLLGRGMGGAGVSLYDRVVVPPMRVLEGLVAPPVGKNVLLVGRKPG